MGADRDPDIAPPPLLIGLAATDADLQAGRGRGHVVDVQPDQVAAAEAAGEAEEEERPVAVAGAGGGGGGVEALLPQVRERERPRLGGRGAPEASAPDEGRTDQGVLGGSRHDPGGAVGVGDGGDLALDRGHRPRGVGAGRGVGGDARGGGRAEGRGGARGGRGAWSPAGRPAGPRCP